MASPCDVCSVEVCEGWPEEVEDIEDDVGCKAACTSVIHDFKRKPLFGLIPGKITKLEPMKTFESKVFGLAYDYDRKPRNVVELNVEQAKAIFDRKDCHPESDPLPGGVIDLSVSPFNVPPRPPKPAPLQARVIDAGDRRALRMILLQVLPAWITLGFVIWFCWL